MRRALGSAVGLGSSARWHASLLKRLGSSGATTFASRHSSSSSSTSTLSADSIEREELVRLVHRGVSSTSATAAASTPTSRTIPLEDLLIQSAAREGKAASAPVGSHLLPSTAMRVDAQLRPRRVPRAATVLVDGDQLSAECIDALCTALDLVKEECRIFIARQPRTPPLSVIDTVAPTDVYVPTACLIEVKMKEWLQTHAPILQDIIFLCADSQWKLYEEHVVPKCGYEVVVQQAEEVGEKDHAASAEGKLVHIRSDADVYLASPSRVALVIPKHVIPVTAF